MYALKLVGLANGPRTPHDGRYLMEYDPRWRSESERVVDEDGHMLLIYLFRTTDDIRKAMRFETPTAAFSVWKSVSPNLPTRPDGKPNRPLTAFTAEVVPVPT